MPIVAAPSLPAALASPARSLKSPMPQSRPLRNP
jgi:hypothetical protein